MKYKRILVSKTGGPEVLEVAEEEVKPPGKDEVCVRVSAAGVAFGDIAKCQGMMPGAPKAPFTPGYDIVGQVEKIGEGVEGFEIGQQVAAFVENGGYTQYACVKAHKLIPVPDGLDTFELACLPLNYLTAFRMLHQEARVPKNGSILVHGAGGGVGTALLDLGKLDDLKMFGTASASKRDVVKEYGGRPINYREDDFVAVVKKEEPGGVDAVFDPIDAANWKRSITVLKRGRTMVVYGMTSSFKRGVGKVGLVRQMASLALLIVKPGKRVKFFAINIGKDPLAYHNDMGKLTELLVEKNIKPLVGKVLPLEEANQAHKLLLGSKVAGKIVLDCS